MQTLVDAPLRPRVGVRRSAPGTPRVDHRAEYVAVAAAAVTAIVADAAPTGTWLFDLVYRFVAVVVIIGAAARARRWTLLVLSAVAATFTATLLAQVAAVAAIVATTWYLGRPTRRRLIASSIGALAVPALFFQGPEPIERTLGVPDPVGASALLGVIAVAPVLVSAWDRLGRRDRLRLRRLGRRALVAAGGACLLAGISVAASIPSGRAAVTASRAAVDAGRDGSIDEVEVHLSVAADAWERTLRRLNGPWLLPARAVPVVSQHLAVAQSGVQHGSELTASAHRAVATADVDTLVADGQVDIEQLAALAPAAARLESATATALDGLTSVESPWLIGPVADPLRRAIERLETATSSTAGLTAAVELGRDLLGSPTGSTVVMMFSTPAEARGSGGFVGNWAEFEARDGRLELVEQYRSKQLNDALLAQGASLSADDDYLRRYERFRIHEHVQDVTMSPDFPSVASVAAGLYEKATGRRVDAIVMIDPFVLESLLAFSGPVDAGGFALSAASASSELLRGQYERFEEDDDERTALLDQVAAEVIDRLLAEPPDPIAFATELAPLARQQRISLWVAADEDGAAVERLGLAGAFPRDGDDVLAVVHQNAAQNKIDTLLERSIDVSTLVDTSTGWVTHDVGIELENRAPASGLPESIIGSNDQGLPLGTNRMLLTVYSPFPMTDARLNGEPVAVETQREFGRLAHTVLVTMAPGSSATFEFELSGRIELGDGYELRVPVQPLAQPDDVTWTISGLGRTTEVPAGWTASDRGLALVGSIREPERFVFGPDS